MSDERFLTELREQLVAAASRRAEGSPDEPPAISHHPTPRPVGRAVRRMVELAAAVVVVLAVVVAALLLRDPTPAAASVDITIDGNDLVVRLTDLETRPEQIVSAAKKAGLDVRVETVPVGPSQVGRFIGATATSLPPELRRTDGSTLAFTGFRIPRDWSGTLSLSLGRPARDGEEWVGVADALAPGGAAACRELLGATVDDAAAALDELGLTVRWFVFDPTEKEVTDRRSDYGSWRVISVMSTSDDAALVQATSDGSWPFPDASMRPVMDPSC